MAPLLLLLAAGFLHALTATKTTPYSNTKELCIDVQRDCEKDLSCGFASIQFKTDCPHIEGTQNIYVSNAQTTIPGNCSNACVKAIEKLKETKKGSELYNCDCQLDGDCLTLKARVAKCLNMADDAWRRRTSCTVAKNNCSDNSHCNKLQNHFLRACNNMINGVKCEDKCMKAQKKLLANEHGKYWFVCECDGPVEAYCRAIQAHAKQLHCLPGMDGTGMPVFEYHHTDIIHGEEDIRNSSCAPLRSYVLPWMLVFALIISNVVRDGL